MNENKKLQKAKLKVFIVDTSIIKEILTNQYNGVKYLKEFENMKQNKIPFKVMTTNSSFKRALYDCVNFSNPQNLKSILDLIDIYEDNNDFKDNKKINNKEKFPRKINRHMKGYNLIKSKEKEK